MMNKKSFKKEQKSIKNQDSQDQLIIKTIKNLIPFSFLLYIFSYSYTYMYLRGIGSPGLISAYSVTNLISKSIPLGLIFLFLLFNRIVAQKSLRNTYVRIITTSLSLLLIYWLYTSIENATLKFTLISLGYIIYTSPDLVDIEIWINSLGSSKKILIEHRTISIFAIPLSTVASLLIYASFVSSLDISTEFQRKPIAQDLDHVEMRVIDTAGAYSIVFYPSTQQITLLESTEVKYPFKPIVNTKKAKQYYESTYPVVP